MTKHKCEGEKIWPERKLKIHQLLQNVEILTKKSVSLRRGNKDETLGYASSSLVKLN